LSIGYISGEPRGRRQEAKGGINNQFLITEFSIITDASAAACKHPTEKLMRGGFGGVAPPPKAWIE